MRRIKSAPANIAEMVNRRQPDKPTKNKTVVVPPKNRDNFPKPLFEKGRKSVIFRDKPAAVFGYHVLLAYCFLIYVTIESSSIFS